MFVISLDPKKVALESINFVNGDGQTVKTLRMKGGNRIFELQVTGPTLQAAITNLITNMSMINTAVAVHTKPEGKPGAGFVAMIGAPDIRFDVMTGATEIKVPYTYVCDAEDLDEIHKRVWVIKELFDKAVGSFEVVSDVTGGQDPEGVVLVNREDKLLGDKTRENDIEAEIEGDTNENKS